MKDVKRGVWIRQSYTDMETARELYRKFTDMGLHCCIWVRKEEQTHEEYSHKEFEDYWK